MSVKLNHSQKIVLTGTPDSVCKIGNKIYACSNDGDTGYLYQFDIDGAGVLQQSLVENYTHTVKRITTDGNSIFSVSDLNGVAQIIRAFDPVTHNALGSTYNMGDTIYGPIHVSTAGFVVAQRQWMTGVAFDNTRLLRFDGSAFMEIARFPARHVYHLIGLRMLSILISPSVKGHVYYLGADRTISSTVNLPLASGENIISRGGAILSETRVALAEPLRITLYSTPEGEILDSIPINLGNMGRTVTDGRYLYITNGTDPNLVVYDTHDDKLRFVDSISFPTEESGLTSVHIQNIVYGSNRIFVLSVEGIQVFTKTLAADFVISNPTPAVGETVTFEVV